MSDSIVITRKVRVTDNTLGSPNARLSNTASGKAQSMANHPAGKGRERSVIEGLLLSSGLDPQAEYEAAVAWLAEYEEVRAELETRRVERERLKAERRRKFLSDVGEFDS
jgi:hypothetical protein